MLEVILEIIIVFLVIEACYMVFKIVFIAGVYVYCLLSDNVHEFKDILGRRRKKMKQLREWNKEFDKEFYNKSQSKKIKTNENSRTIR